MIDKGTSRYLFPRGRGGARSEYVWTKSYDFQWNGGESFVAKGVLKGKRKAGVE